MRLASSGSTPPAIREEGRTRWPAPPCCPTESTRRRRPPAWLLSTRRASIGWLGWDRRTSTSSRPSRRAIPELQAFLETSAEEFGSLTGDQVLAALGDLISDADRAVLTGAFAEHEAAALRESLRNGIWGWFDDDKAFFADWGFDLGEIETPVTIWQGEEDRMVPFAHGKWLAAHVSGAKARLLPGEGHLSLEVGSYGDVLDDLIASRI
jgi:pimeloyl-ACP methyl ester carboxylesterase